MSGDDEELLRSQPQVTAGLMPVEAGYSDLGSRPDLQTNPAGEPARRDRYRVRPWAAVVGRAGHLPRRGAIT